MNVAEVRHGGLKFEFLCRKQLLMHLFLRQIQQTLGLKLVLFDGIGDFSHGIP